MNRRELIKFGIASAAAALPTPAFAYPDRPIRLIVPFSPGGATDVAARLWAERMKGPLGTVVIENKGGGGGVIGATEVARSTPDGHTLLFGNTSTQVLIPAIAEKPAYDPVKDFQAVYLMCNSPTSIVVHESVPAKTLQGFIAYAKANPTKLSYGTAGTGTLTHLAGELFKQLIGVPGITHVPYKGAAPGVADLASGHIPMMTPNVGGPLLQFHATGKVRILAINAETRLAAAPDIPTAIEAGLPGMIAANFQRPVRAGRRAQAGGRPAGAAHQGGACREGRARCADQVGLRADHRIPARMRVSRRWRDELKRWTPIVKATNFKI